MFYNYIKEPKSVKNKVRWFRSFYEYLKPNAIIVDISTDKIESEK